MINQYKLMKTYPLPIPHIGDVLKLDEPFRFVSHKGFTDILESSLFVVLPCSCHYDRKKRSPLEIDACGAHVAIYDEKTEYKDLVGCGYCLWHRGTGWLCNGYIINNLLENSVTPVKEEKFCTCSFPKPVLLIFDTICDNCGKTIR